ncbi:CU044_5270 family protein [Nonomuraea sp. NBC_01738]|uniref:CU044_5270 family protein n=1 Tax=Nonomuraea sp. NBC_01738 TaxID=2976003 RepID=UPI002E0EE133|nr:CU044_5270 family protein [Nonomuraea sp. NBC_01738]
MDDEIRMFAEGRPSAPPYPSEARERARAELLREAAGRGRFRLPRVGWQAAAAFGVTVALVGGVAFTLSGTLSGRGGESGPATRVASVVSTFDTPGELAPKPGQFVLVESETMFTSETVGETVSRHLYRTKRKLWRSADGSADGLLMIEGLAPKPWPGTTELPADAKNWQGTRWSVLASCRQTRMDYAILGELPTEPAAIRERLYAQNQVGEGKDLEVDGQVFRAVGDLFRETYLPKAQRDAIFEAALTIPGVQRADGVADAAGRQGMALGRVSHGRLDQFIFVPDTHIYLGERTTVVDAAEAEAPVGSVLALTAESASVVDRLPDAPDADRDDSCTPQSAEPTATSTSAPIPTEAVTEAATEATTGAPDPVPTKTGAVPAETGPVATPTKAPEKIKPTPIPTITKTPIPSQG